MTKIGNVHKTEQIKKKNKSKKSKGISKSDQSKIKFIDKNIELKESLIMDITNDTGETEQIKKKKKGKKDKDISKSDQSEIKVSNINTELEDSLIMAITNDAGETEQIKKNKKGKKNKDISNDACETEQIKKKKGKKDRDISKFEQSKTKIVNKNNKLEESLNITEIVNDVGETQQIKNKSKMDRDISKSDQSKVVDNNNELKESIKLQVKDRLSHLRNYRKNFALDDFGFNDYFKSKENKDFKEILKSGALATVEDMPPPTNNDIERERTLCVDNVKIGTNKKDLIRLFKQYGKLDSIRFRNLPLVNNKEYKMKQVIEKKYRPNRISMTAYVKFVNAADREKAMEAHMTVLNEHHLLCRRGKEFGAVKQELKKGRTVFVGGLNRDGEEERVYAKFSECGEIIDIVLPRRDTLCTGVAFITFAETSSLAAALALDATHLGPCRLRVSKAVRKVKKQKKNMSGSGVKGFHKKVPVQRKKVKTAIEKTAAAALASGKAASAPTTNGKAASAPTTNGKAAPAPTTNGKAAAAPTTNGKAAADASANEKPAAVVANHGVKSLTSSSKKFSGTKHEQRMKSKKTKKSQVDKEKSKFSKMLTLADKDKKK